MTEEEMPSGVVTVILCAYGSTELLLAAEVIMATIEETVESDIVLVTI